MRGMQSPIFVGGTGRSGTTWLAQMLGEHPDVWSVPVESRFLIDPGGLQDLVRDLSTSYTPYHASAALYRIDDLLTKRLSGRREDGSYADWNVHDAVGRDRFEHWQKRFLAELEAFSVNHLRVGRYFPDRQDAVDLCASYVGELFGGAAERNGKSRWCEKTPLNLLSMDFLWELFPHARIIHIMRHPVQVAASHVSSSWAPTRLDEVCGWLEPLYLRWLSFKESYDLDERCVEITLEELGSDWPTSRTRLFTALGLADAEVSPPDVDRILHWNPLAADDEAYVRGRLGFAIEALGYS